MSSIDTYKIVLAMKEYARSLKSDNVPVNQVIGQLRKFSYQAVNEVFFHE
ncbi:MAG: hypothetical protein WC455_28915 [Dehalococcoidia bacterium]|jgi:hypothetical protein